jgi:hypothetical protein
MSCIFAHPIWLATVTAILIPFVLFLIEYRIERRDEKKDHFFITLAPIEQIRVGKSDIKSTGKPVDFGPRIGYYLKVAEVMLTLASASLVFIPTLHLAKSIAQPALAFAIVLLGFTVMFGVAFMAWMTYCYEMFLYSPLNFGAFESSAMFTLGFSALGCFGVAYLSLAFGIANAYARGTLTGSA